MMKKSNAVPATLVTAMAAALVGCRGATRECVDNFGARRPDSECVANGGGPAMNPHWRTLSSSRGYRSYGPTFIPPIGRTPSYPSTGSRPSVGGSSTSPGVSRGGFGGSGGSFGG